MSPFFVHQRPVVLVAAMSALSLAVSCTSEPTQGVAASSSSNRPPVIKSVKFLHEPIPLTGPIAVQIVAEDPEREPVLFQYQWYVNNAPVAGQTNPTLPAELLRRGQLVSVEIVPADTTQQGEPFRTAAVAVGNTAPRVTSVTLAPLIAQPGERVEAQAEASDPDHDRTDLTYRWYRNTTMIKEGEDSFLDTTGFAARDQVVVEVTVHDPAAMGNSLRSSPLTLGNRLPKIISVPPAPGPGGQYEYVVAAVDPDGDRMIYELETAPSGMTINEQSGQIAWPVPATQFGTFHVRVVAKDGQGGAAFQEFDLTLADPTSVKPAGA